MKTMLVALMVLVSAQFIAGQEVDSDAAKLLAEISKICSDRWYVDVGDGSHVYLNSKQKALGRAPGYNFGPGEKEYALHFRFKIVEPVPANVAAKVRAELKELEARGKGIESDSRSPVTTYAPKTEEEWSLVLSIMKAKTKVEDIPEYRFKSVYLSEDYAMAFFVPNKNDSNAMAYKQDIEKIYKLLEKTGLR